MRNRIIRRIKKTNRGIVVITEGSTHFGPFKDRYTLVRDTIIGQRAMNWLAANPGVLDEEE